MRLDCSLHCILVEADRIVMMAEVMSVSVGFTVLPCVYLPDGMCLPTHLSRAVCARQSSWLSRNSTAIWSIFAVRLERLQPRYASLTLSASVSTMWMNLALYFASSSLRMLKRAVCLPLPSWLRSDFDANQWVVTAYWCLYDRVVFDCLIGLGHDMVDF